MGKIYVHLSYTQLCQSDWKRYAQKTLSCTTALDLQRERERERQRERERDTHTHMHSKEIMILSFTVLYCEKSDHSLLAHLTHMHTIPK